MRNYEIMFIIRPSVEDATLKSITDELQKVFKNNKSKVVEFKELGQKKFAYPIKKELSGYYFLMLVEANVEAINEFKHKISINENILRDLVIKKETENKE